MSCLQSTCTVLLVNFIKDGLGHIYYIKFSAINKLRFRITKFGSGGCTFVAGFGDLFTTTKTHNLNSVAHIKVLHHDQFCILYAPYFLTLQCMCHNTLVRQYNEEASWAKLPSIDSAIHMDEDNIAIQVIESLKNIQKWLAWLIFIIDDAENVRHHQNQLINQRKADDYKIVIIITRTFLEWHYSTRKSLFLQDKPSENLIFRHFRQLLFWTDYCKYCTVVSPCWTRWRLFGRVDNKETDEDKAKPVVRRGWKATGPLANSWVALLQE